MERYTTERRLSVAYSLIVVLGLMTTICSAVAWNHWKYVLDVCPDVNCGCILYGISAYTYFTGGHISSCSFVIYGPIPIIAVALVMSAFHVLRVCINSIGKYEDDNTTTIEQRERQTVIMTTRAEVKETDPVTYCWIPASVFGVLFAIYTLAIAAVLTDGYYKTCNQYRGELIKSLRATGSQVRTIHSRLSCQAIYDFMDYLQPDVLDNRRGDIINTGVTLQLAIVCAWFMCFTWLYVAVLNSIRAHRDKEVSTCCGR